MSKLLSKPKKKAVRVLVSMPDEFLKVADTVAEHYGYTRSEFIRLAIQEYVYRGRK